jgi:hypothetical protein
MSERILVVLILASMVLAFAAGIWIGLGYPGVYDRHEDTGTRAPRKSPYRILLDRIGEWVRSAVDRLVERASGD